MQYWCCGCSICSYETLSKCILQHMYIYAYIYVYFYINVHDQFLKRYIYMIHISDGYPDIANYASCINFLYRQYTIIFVYTMVYNSYITNYLIWLIHKLLQLYWFSVHIIPDSNISMTQHSLQRSPIIIIVGTRYHTHSLTQVYLESKLRFSLLI